MKLIVSRPVYPEIGEGRYPGFRFLGEVALELAIGVSGQLKLNLDVPAGEAVTLGIEDHDFHGRIDVPVLANIGRLNLKRQPGRLSRAAITAGTTTTTSSDRRGAEGDDPDAGYHRVEGVGLGRAQRPPGAGLPVVSGGGSAGAYVATA